jgi:hypothetical protein
MSPMVFEINNFMLCFAEIIIIRQFIRFYKRMESETTFSMLFIYSNLLLTIGRSTVKSYTAKHLYI